MLSTSRLALLFLAVNTSYTCMAMLKKKTGHSITIGEMGGIQSLCTATNGTSEICIIGHAFNETFVIGRLSTADQITKSLLRPMLDIWSSSDNPITLLNFDTQATCSQHELMSSKHPRDVDFHLPLQAALNAFAAQTGYKHKSLHFVCTPPLGAFEEYQWHPGFIFGYEAFPGLAEQVQFTHKDLVGLDKELASSNPVVRTRFFQKNYSDFKALLASMSLSKSDLWY